MTLHIISNTDLFEPTSSDPLITKREGSTRVLNRLIASLNPNRDAIVVQHIHNLEGLSYLLARCALSAATLTIYVLDDGNNRSMTNELVDNEQATATNQQAAGEQIDVTSIQLISYAQWVDLCCDYSPILTW